MKNQKLYQKNEAIMTKLLNQAFSEASKLRTNEQNLLAKWLLELLKSEQKWDVLFAQSQDNLSELADEALLEHQRGKTQPLNPETL
jgi:hypothetical protein